MTFASRPPGRPELVGLVERIWFCEFDSATGPEGLLPTGRAQLVFGLHPSASMAVIQGPMSTVGTIDSTAQRRAVGVAFGTGGLAGFVDDDAPGFVDRQVEAADVWGRRCEFLAEELAGLVQGSDVIDRVEQELAAWLRPERVEGHGRLDLVERRLRLGAPVAAIVAAADVDRRVLAAQFRSRVGFGLKHYGRLCRFERSVRAIRHPDSPSLATVAAELGYADQSHLTREFRTFSGLTPALLHRRASTSPNHIPADLRPD